MVKLGPENFQGAESIVWERLQGTAFLPAGGYEPPLGGSIPQYHILVEMPKKWTPETSPTRG